MAQDSFTYHDNLYVEQRVANEKPSALVAYLLWFFLGYFGVHRFYLGRWFSGLFMLSMLGIGTLTAPIFIGFVPLLILGIMWVVDLLLIPGMISNDIDRLRRKYR